MEDRLGDLRGIVARRDEALAASMNSISEVSSTSRIIQGGKGRANRIGDGDSSYDVGDDDHIGSVSSSSKVYGDGVGRPAFHDEGFSGSGAGGSKSLSAPSSSSSSSSWSSWVRKKGKVSGHRKYDDGDNHDVHADGYDVPDDSSKIHSDSHGTKSDRHMILASDHAAYADGRDVHAGEDGGDVRDEDRHITGGGRRGTEGAQDEDDWSENAGDGEEEEVPEFMSEYLKQVRVIKAAMHEIGQNVRKMKQLKGDVLESTSPETEREISHFLHKILDTTNTLIFKTKRALEALKAENDAMAEETAYSSELQIRVNIQQALTQKLRDLIMLFQAAQTDFKHDVHAKMARQIRMVYPDASSEEIDSLVESGDMSSSAAASALRMKLKGSGNLSLKYALSDIEDKYRDVRRLEESVAELHQLFVEMNFLVDQQGELLNRIEFSVRQAKEHTEKAEMNLVQARKNQKSASKRMCCLTVCCLILLVVILVPVLLYVLK